MALESMPTSPESSLQSISMLHLPTSSRICSELDQSSDYNMGELLSQADSDSLDSEDDTSATLAPSVLSKPRRNHLSILMSMM